MPDMKACPFCASRNIQIVLNHVKMETTQCLECGASGPRWLDGSPQDGWNTRATSSVEALDQLAETAARLSDFAAGLRDLAALAPDAEKGGARDEN